MKNGKRTTVAACSIQNALRQMKADEGSPGWYSVSDSWLDLEWIFNQPSFSTYCCWCVCFVSTTTHIIHTWKLSRWSHIRISVLMLIRWHRWVDITKRVWETQLLQHNFLSEHTTSCSICHVKQFLTFLFFFQGTLVNLLLFFSSL